MISVQKESFLFEKILHDLKSASDDIGAVVSFIGFVRDFETGLDCKGDHLEIEYYEGMTQKSLQNIEQISRKKWNLIDLRIYHRFGIIKLNEPIVYIVVASKHRDDAFDACRFVIDYLKTEAPFWKKEVSKKQSYWVEQKESDLVKVK
jgi:molybdopterin synthase catalytic subunit